MATAAQSGGANAAEASAPGLDAQPTSSSTPRTQPVSPCRPSAVVGRVSLASVLANQEVEHLYRATDVAGERHRFLFGLLEPLPSQLVLAALDPASRRALRLSCRAGHALVAARDRRLAVASEAAAEALAAAVETPHDADAGTEAETEADAEADAEAAAVALLLGTGCADAEALQSSALGSMMDSFGAGLGGWRGGHAGASQAASGGEGLSERGRGNANCPCAALATAMSVEELGGPALPRTSAAAAAAAEALAAGEVEAAALLREAEAEAEAAEVAQRGANVAQSMPPPRGDGAKTKGAGGRWLRPPPSEPSRRARSTPSFMDLVPPHEAPRPPPAAAVATTAPPALTALSVASWSGAGTDRDAGGGHAAPAAAGAGVSGAGLRIPTLPSTATGPTPYASCLPSEVSAEESAPVSVYSSVQPPTPEQQPHTPFHTASELDLQGPGPAPSGLKAATRCLAPPPPMAAATAQSGTSTLQPDSPQPASPTVAIKRLLPRAAARAAASRRPQASKPARTLLEALHPSLRELCIALPGPTQPAPLERAPAPTDGACGSPGALVPSPAPPSLCPPSLTLLLGSGALRGLPWLRLLDLCGCGPALQLDLACWGALAGGLPEGREVRLRLPLRLLPPEPQPPAIEAFAQDAALALVPSRARAHAQPQPQPAQAPAPAAAQAAAGGDAGAAVVPAPRSGAGLPYMVHPRLLVSAEWAAQLLGQLAAARPGVAVELAPFSDARCDRAFIRAARASTSAGSSAGGAPSLAALSALRSAPLYLTPDLYEPLPGQPQGAPAQGGRKHAVSALRALPPRLTCLSLSGFVPDDTGLLDTLAGLTQLKKLYLVGMVLGTRGVGQLSRLPCLEHITVDVLTLSPRPQAAGPNGAPPPPPPPPAVLPKLRSLAVHDLIASSGTRLAAVAPQLESLAMGDTSSGVESADLRRRQRSRDTNATLRRQFLASGGLVGLTNLRRLELWDKVYPLSELAGSSLRLRELLLHDQAGGPWTAELAHWAAAACPALAHLTLAGLTSACRSPPAPVVTGAGGVRYLRMPPPLPPLPQDLQLRAMGGGAGPQAHPPAAEALAADRLPLPARMLMLPAPLIPAAALVAAAAAAPAGGAGPAAAAAPSRRRLAPAGFWVEGVAAPPQPCCAVDERLLLAAPGLTLRRADAATLQQLVTAATRRLASAARLTKLRLVELGPCASEAAVSRLLLMLPGLTDLELRRCAALGEAWAQGLGRRGLRVSFQAPRPGGDSAAQCDVGDASTEETAFV
ncbi:hypothetical protein HYH03_012403 [Edaphochlamys debaryana]|uniref:Uncharacterized protein n=1 Tax=Edaphochlamys debaryana TaxID=47281 RepID=A0A836BUL4_9CHLO|nr:hypothetical protein HYH03_012403 [Edaphochlamys debaryana]|eukprot:KAG2489177.1 hypothetical protein HYH03_012403 [Edaphochlamys debaryana]